MGGGCERAGGWNQARNGAEMPLESTTWGRLVCRYLWAGFSRKMAKKGQYGDIPMGIIFKGC